MKYYFSPRAFIAFTFLLNIILPFNTILSMEFKDLDDDSLLKEQYKSAQQTAKLTENIPLLDYKPKDYSSTQLTEEKLHDDSDEDSNVEKLPPELREYIYHYLFNDKDKKTIATLCYILIADPYITEATKNMMRDKIAVYHAQYIIDKTSNCKDNYKKWLALKRTAVDGNNGVTYWNDLPQFSAWGVGSNFKKDIKKQLREYIASTNQKAEDLDEKLQEFCDELKDISHSLDQLSEEDALLLETDNEITPLFIENKQRFELIQKYYDTRCQFLEIPNHLQYEFRENFNVLYENLRLLRCCAPVHGFSCGTALCITGCLVKSSVISMAGCAFLLAGCIFIPIIHYDDSGLCNKSQEIDNCEFLTHMPNTKKYVNVAQKQIMNFKKERK